MNKNVKVGIHQIGIHTFECKIDHLKKSEFKYLESKFKHIRNNYHSTDYTNVYRTVKQKGIRIKLTAHKFHELYVIVTPWILLNGILDYSKIMTSFDKQEFENALDSALRYYFGDEFGLERFRLSRVDCTCDLILSENITWEYIDLIKRSNKSKQGKLRFSKKIADENKVDEDDPKVVKLLYYKIGDENIEAFSAYDKIYDLITKKQLSGNPGYGLLRLEREFCNRSICELRKYLGSDKVTDLIEYYWKNSGRLIREYISYHFNNGDYYSYETAKQIIENGVSINKVKNTMLKCLCKSIRSNDYKEYMTKIESITGTDAKKRTILQNLSRLNINPVTIRTGSEYLLGLCTILGIVPESDW